MKYKREKDFLQVLCREYLESLLENVGWTESQATLIRERYIRHYSILHTCLNMAITSTTYARYFENALAKLQTFLVLHKDEEIFKFY